MKIDPKLTVNLGNEAFSETPFPDSVDDAVLWRRFKSGSESAFIEIYRKFFDGLFVYGCQFTKREELVEDAVQDLFLDLRRRREKLGDTDNIRFYLFVSLKRRLVRELSKWYNRWEGFSGEIVFQASLPHEQFLIQQQLDEQTAKNLSKAVSRLPAKKREILYYFYYENLTYEQIREIMDFRKVKSVRNLLYETIGILRSTFPK
ncbi:MAG: sigma-70 family RNA polymerase sigma factor [Lunatimonas sp.]|uniref:RNA polymerase sigma factor n=1 Tax=Lunatimonas sp. TaxID=2060141 RepID=UPI00263A810E|nr:sigma-70 family RNA polymerase sigma factor [Lunatimonas sp.]MCC5938816.1 sigma-70 family RNA polymerase sigma factor [Lunatimonas sp.]